MSIPSPPRLSCDTKKCIYTSQKSSRNTKIISEEYRTPKDLPGEAKDVIKPDSFFHMKIRKV